MEKSFGRVNFRNGWRGEKLVELPTTGTELFNRLRLLQRVLGKVKARSAKSSNHKIYKRA